MYNKIKDLENKKASLLIEMGMITYQKLRDNIIIDEDFESISKDILELDKSIYNEHLELDKLNALKSKKKCDCGNELNNLDKFCSVCGKGIEEDYKEFITCEKCDEQIDIDSNYCICCGNKI